LLTLLYLWSVLLVGSLDEYLEDLELTQETRQQVKAATLNFAQAALVLQNSSGIYSRKVDYLHSHVYKVQEELSLNELLGGAKAGNKKGGRGGNKTGIDAQVEEFLNFDPHLEFLLLDDVLPTDTTDECHKINLAQESSTGSALAGTAATDTDQSVLTTGTRLSMGSVLNRRLSLGSSVGTGTTRSGMTMMDQTGFTNNHGNGKPNLVAAQRAFLGTAQDTGSLRLTGGSCDIGEEGVLFLPGSQQQTTYSSQEEPISTHAASGSNPMDFNNGDDDFGGGGGAFDDGMDDNDDDGGAAFVMADNDQNDDAAAQQKKRVTFADSTAAAAPKIHKPVPVVDPWALLDRDAPDSKKARPLRVGKTIVLPDSMDALPSECVTGSRTRRVARKQQRERVLRRDKTASSSLAAQTFQQVMTTTTNTLLGQKRALEDASSSATTAAIPLKGLAYGNEFAYIAKATAKRKAEERRALRKQQQQDAAAVAVELDDGDDGGFGFGGGHGDYDDEDDNDFGGGGDVFGDDDGNNGPMLNSNTGIASVDDVYQKNWNGASSSLSLLFRIVLCDFTLHTSVEH